MKSAWPLGFHKVFQKGNFYLLSQTPLFSSTGDFVAIKVGKAGQKQRASDLWVSTEKGFE